MGAEIFRARDDLPCVDKESASGLAELWSALAAIEERDAERRLERLHGLAYGRLDTAKPPRGGGEAAGIGHRKEDAQLI